MPRGLFYHNSLDWFISNIRGAWLVFIPCFIEILVFDANSVDPDVVSDLGLHCLQMSLLWNGGLKWIKPILFL